MFPKLVDVIAAIEDLKARRFIQDYAISGAMAALFWDEAVVTFDLDVLVRLGSVADALRPLREIYAAAEREYPVQAEHIVISDFPVRFLPAPDVLSEEAVVNAAAIEVEGIEIRVVRPEYLVALWLRPGPASTRPRRERAAKLQESAEIDADLLADLKARYGFLGMPFEETIRALRDGKRRFATRGSAPQSKRSSSICGAVSTFTFRSYKVVARSSRGSGHGTSTSDPRRARSELTRLDLSQGSFK